MPSYLHFVYVFRNNMYTNSSRSKTYQFPYLGGDLAVILNVMIIVAKGIIYCVYENLGRFNYYFFLVFPLRVCSRQGHLSAQPNGKFTSYTQEHFLPKLLPHIPKNWDVTRTLQISYCFPVTNYDFWDSFWDNDQGPLNCNR